MFSPYFEAYQILKPYAVGLDLEKYYDIYEISHTDMEDAELVANVKTSDIEDADTLQDLKIGLQKLHIIRKLLLCTLLALNADGSNLDFQRWSSANKTMGNVSEMTAKMTSTIDGIMGEEEGETADYTFRKVFAETNFERLPDPPYTKVTLDTRQGAYAKPDATIGESVSRYPRATSEDAVAP